MSTAPLTVLVAVDDPIGATLGRELEREGLSVVAVVAAPAVSLFAEDGALGNEAEQVAAGLAAVDVLVLHSTRRTLTAAVVAACDRHAVRIVPLCERAADERLAAAFGIGEAASLEVAGWELADLLTGASAPTSPTGRMTEVRPSEAEVSEPRSGRRRAPDGAPHPSPGRTPGRAARVIAVWGPPGAPGRSTMAIELAVELARGGRHVGLVDADSHAPSIALALGLADEAPGFAAACRQSELGGLDSRELTRISAPIGRTGVDVLTGLNRPSRWPELSESRVSSALEVCREWADHTVVDVAASLERDEEIVSDLDGPRRNAATLAALRTADLIVAVAGADPLGISRFLRAYPELRATIGTTPVVVLANRLRPGALGIDARGQVRRTLDRFGGIEDVWFVPLDPRAADGALLAARPIAEVSARSPITLAIRRFVGEAVAPAAEPAPRRSRARSATVRGSAFSRHLRLRGVDAQ